MEQTAHLNNEELQNIKEKIEEALSSIRFLMLKTQLESVITELVQRRRVGCPAYNPDIGCSKAVPLFNTFGVLQTSGEITGQKCQGDPLKCPFFPEYEIEKAPEEEKND